MIFSSVTHLLLLLVLLVEHVIGRLLAPPAHRQRLVQHQAFVRPGGEYLLRRRQPLVLRRPDVSHDPQKRESPETPEPGVPVRVVVTGVLGRGKELQVEDAQPSRMVETLVLSAKSA